MQSIDAFDNIVRESIHKLHLRPLLNPPQQRHATALRAKIDRDQRTAVLRAAGRHRRYASVSPPSTGIKWPVVTGAFGPPTNKIASAQSFGSIGTCVSVRFA